LCCALGFDRTRHPAGCAGSCFRCVLERRYPGCCHVSHLTPHKGTRHTSHISRQTPNTTQALITRHASNVTCARIACTRACSLSKQSDNQPMASAGEGGMSEGERVTCRTEQRKMSCVTRNRGTRDMSNVTRDTSPAAPSFHCSTSSGAEEEAWWMTPSQG